MIKRYRKYKQMPPGLIGYPLLGSFVSVIQNGHKFYIEIARQSNDKLCTINIGTTPIICINDSKIMKTIFDKECASWRPNNMFFKNDVLAQMAFHFGGSHWKKRRRFFQTNLMTMMNKNFVDKNIKLLINKTLIPKLDELSKNNKLWHCLVDIQYVTLSIAYNCIFGGYLDKNDESIKKYMFNFDAWLHQIQLNSLRYFLFGEKIQTFIEKNICGNKLNAIYKEQIEITRKWALNAHKTYNKNNINSYYDHVYYELCSINPDASYNDIITDEIIADMSIAIDGSADTTAATLEFCIGIAAKYTIIQDEIYKEIMENIHDKIEFDLFSKIYQLHKLRAFIFESLRMAPVAPIAVFRQIRKKNGLKVNVDNKQYILPNDCIILPNIIGMQMDPKKWKNPHQFNINRWLTKDGKFKKSLNPMIMNFSFGERGCPGKALGLKKLYLLIAILFTKYKFFYHEPEKINIELKMDFLLHVQPPIACRVSKR